MNPKPRTPSTHRLQRYHRWAMLWLKWFVGFLDAAATFAPLSQQATAIAHRWLDLIERYVVGVALLRALPLMRDVPQPAWRAHQTRRVETQLRRAILGSALRRLLRPKDLRQRIAALSQDIDRLVARFLKRLPCGLTRRRSIRPRPEARSLEFCVPRVSTAHPADTS